MAGWMLKTDLMSWWFFLFYRPSVSTVYAQKHRSYNCSIFVFGAIEVLRIKVTLKKARLLFLSTGRFDGTCAAALQKDWSIR
jgi:hypothetical protein